MSIFDKLTSPEAKAFIAQVEQPFSQLPHLPAGVVNFLVSIAPYVAILGGILMIISVPLHALATGLALLTLNPISALFILLGGALSLASAVILLMAYKPLKEKQITGWYYMFWVQVISVVSTIVLAVGGDLGGIVSGLIGLAIGMYVLFEMKRSYSQV